MPVTPVATPEEVTLHGDMYAVKHLAFAPDGKTLAACTRSRERGCEQEVVKLYDVATLRERLRFRSAEDHGPTEINFVSAAAYAPDGRTLATGDVHLLSLWDVATGARRPSFEQPINVDHLTFAPDGRALGLAISGQDPAIFDVATAKPRAVLRGHGTHSPAHHRRVNAITFAPDGKTVATAGDDQTVRLWDADTGRPLRKVEGPAPYYSLAFAPDGKTLAAGTDHGEAGPHQNYAVRLLDAATGAERAVMLGHDHQVCALAFTPDGRRLLSLGRRTDVRLWDVAAARQVAAFARPRLYPECLALAPDGKTVALGGWIGGPIGGVITLLDLEGDAFRLRKPAPERP